jgi:acyl-CoA synthetase (NDP forming)
MEKAGLRLPHLSPEVQAELRQFLPLPSSIISNPVDAMSLVSPEAISATMRMLGKVPDIHMLVYHLGFHTTSRWGGGRLSSAGFVQPVIDALMQVKQANGKPVLLVLRPPLDLPGMKVFLAAQEAFVAAGFPVFYSLRQTAKAMARVVAWNRA